MASARRSCRNNPDVFCYICGEYTLSGDRKNITGFVKRAYMAYFKVKLGDQDKSWAPHTVCKTCVEYLRRWTKGAKTSLKFWIPMVWREPFDHATDCYFCAINTTGINRKNRQSLQYPDLPSARRPVAHCEDIPVPAFTQLPDSDDEATITDERGDTEEFEYEAQDGPQTFSQCELNDLVRDLSLSKISSELLASRLKEKNLLGKDVRITFFRRRHEDYMGYFCQEEDLVYCRDVAGLLVKLGAPQYDPRDWRLFIDSCKRSLKCVLPHNGNQFASIPLAHSTTLKEKYEAVKYVLDKIQYEQHKWIICVDLKMVNFLLGQQSGFTTPALCKERVAGARSVSTWARNIIHEPFVDREKILIPPLHLKLGLMKQFTRALDKDGVLQLPKVKAGIFDGPQIRKLIKTQKCAAWKSFVQVVNNFLGNTKAANHARLISTMIEAFQKLGCLMSIKMHFLFSHMEKFPENLGAMSDEQGEGFHQDMRQMEERYQGRWDAVMMADYCWSLKRDNTAAAHTRESKKRRFMP
ncbi:Uncharacterized protein FKW44_025149 [Caligus rogercresseyi]|uniref:Uncharacterized protein n=1 Tax=Caligus rogercresseyi TaxID=217165 RepID=A0A7T8JSG1_CALRO|nr:Uncharacterized protein FKW44_025149 [Caligus rogercresseyi]